MAIFNSYVSHNQRVAQKSEPLMLEQRTSRSVTQWAVHGGLAVLDAAANLAANWAAMRRSGIFMVMNQPSWGEGKMGMDQYL